MRSQDFVEPCLSSTCHLLAQQRSPPLDSWSALHGRRMRAAAAGNRGGRLPGSGEPHELDGVCITVGPPGSSGTQWASQQLEWRMDWQKEL